MQLRSLAQNITFLAVTRTILTMDSTGTAAAAHTVSSQVFQLGAIAILALSTIATILIPQRMHSKELGGPVVAKAVADRLLAWGVLVGALLFFLQSAAIFALPLFTPDQRRADVGGFTNFDWSGPATIEWDCVCC